MAGTAGPKGELMSDRTSASIFGQLFCMLAEHKRAGTTITPDAMARLVWRLKEEAGADFSDSQMCADEELAALGLARLWVDPDWPEDGEIWLYGPAPTAGS